MKITIQLKQNLIPALLATTLLMTHLVSAWAPVSAAPLTNTYLRLNRMAATSQTDARLVFRTASAGATSVTINMNGADTTTWTGSAGAVNAVQTVSSATCAADTGATALPGTVTAAGNASTGVITISGVTALSAATTYCVDLTSTTALTIPAAGEYHPLITAGSDSITVAVRSVTNDQVVVTAVVPPTFNFVLSGNSDNFTSDLSSSSVGTTAGVTATVNTNARTGWIAWAKDSNTGLTSAAVSKTIASTTPGTSTTLTAGTEGYAFGVAAIAQGSGQGTTTATTAYNATAGAHGSGLDTSYRAIASSTGTASNAVLTLRERAAINALTPAAADYTDTITIIGAGNF